MLLEQYISQMREKRAILRLDNLSILILFTKISHLHSNNSMLNLIKVSSGKTPELSKINANHNPF